jgi:hypothetical protein
LAEERSTGSPTRPKPSRFLRACWERRGLLGAVVVGGLLAALAYVLHDHETGRLTLVARANVRFALNPDFSAALSAYNRAFPPLYPSILWGFHQSSVHIRWLNLLLLYLTLISLWRIARAAIPRVHPAFLVTLYVLCHFNYVNLHQYGSEGLFTLFALLCLALTLRYCRSSSTGNLLALAVLNAGACFTRYIGMVWTLPIAVLQIALASGRSIRRRAIHLGGLLVIALLPVGLWMWDAYVSTGHLTGVDRSEPRWWHRRTTLDSNLFYSAKTLLIDFFSPTRDASNTTVAKRGLALPEETAILAVAVVIGVGLVAACVRASMTSRPAEEATRDGRSRWDRLASAFSSELSVISQFGLGYLGVVIVLWTIGNQDPIHTRFLYPCYLFLILSLFCTYSWVKQRATERWVLAPFWALYALITAVQAYRSLMPLVAGD